MISEGNLKQCAGFHTSGNGLTTEIWKSFTWNCNSWTHLCLHVAIIRIIENNILIWFIFSSSKHILLEISFINERKLQVALAIMVAHHYYNEFKQIVKNHPWQLYFIAMYSMSLFKSLAECYIPSRCSVNINWCWYNSSLLEVVSFSYLCILCFLLSFLDYNAMIKQFPTTSCLGKHT